jgi:hypothetical protein
MPTVIERPRLQEAADDTAHVRSGHDEWLTAAAAAVFAGRIGISTIREACNRNELRHVRIGGTARGPIRTRKEWVTEWLSRWTRGGNRV